VSDVSPDFVAKARHAAIWLPFSTLWNVSAEGASP
jgi:hypothetical protein